MIDDRFHGDSSALAGNFDPHIIHELNCQAASDFAKRSISGSVIVFFAFFITAFSSTFIRDAFTLAFILGLLLLLGVVARIVFMKSLPNFTPVSLLIWKKRTSFVILITALVWGIYVALNMHWYNLTPITMVIMMFTIGIAAGSAQSLFIWKGLAHQYLIFLLLPPYLINLVNWNSASTGILFGLTVYLAFLYIQINRSNSEYWQALSNTKTLEVQKKELEYAKEIAEKANHAKSDFLSSMSHELRTPLNAVLGFTQLLATDTVSPLSPPQQENLKHISQAGHHLLYLINQVLDLAKIETGKLELQLERVTLSKVVDDCIPLVQSLAKQKGIVLDISNINNIAVTADYMQLKQVLINLLTNGIKYNKDGGSLLLRYHELRNGVIKVIIRDTGIGIPEHHQHKVFTSFSRLGQEKSSIEGNGIGLVITKTIIEAMDGNIGFESDEGKGSNFWFELPIAK